MKNLFLVLTGILAVVILGGCGSTKFQGPNVSGKAYETTAIEASLAQYNYSIAGVISAVERGEITPERARILMEVLPVAGDRNHRKSVSISIHHSTRRREHLRDTDDDLEQKILEAGRRGLEKGGTQTPSPIEVPSNF